MAVVRRKRLEDELDKETFSSASVRMIESRSSPLHFSCWGLHANFQWVSFRAEKRWHARRFSLCSFPNQTCYEKGRCEAPLWPSTYIKQNNYSNIFVSERRRL